MSCDISKEEKHMCFDQPKKRLFNCSVAITIVEWPSASKCHLSCSTVALEAIIKITLWIEGLSEYVSLCECVYICECVCREQCKKTQHWLFIYLHKIYSGYKKIKCCRLPGIQTWSRCVGRIFPRTSIFGKETDKIGNNAEKTRFIWIQNRKKKSPSETKIICFFPPQCYSCLSNN